MLTEPLPIEIFVQARFADKQVVNLIENWRVESEVLQKIIVSYFKELGIYSVLPQMEPDLRATLFTWLQSSPEIYQMVRKAELQEMIRRQSRRAD